MQHRREAAEGAFPSARSEQVYENVCLNLRSLRIRTQLGGIEIAIEGCGRGVEHEAAVRAAGQMSLDLGLDRW